MRNNNELDNKNPAPFYHQIASEIRRQIEAGELQPGDALAPLREAAEKWGVHFHTIRHAYAALAREGLVESSRGPRGTRVAPGVSPTPSQTDGDGESLDLYIRDIVDEARRRWSLTQEELAEAIEQFKTADLRPTAFVVECSEHQCALHAAEIRALWDVDARPWVLDHDPPPSGAIIATYFHYNDIRRRWPHLLDQVHFVTIGPSPDSLDFPQFVGPAVVCEKDEDTAETVAADVGRVITNKNLQITTHVVTRAEDALEVDANVLLFPPRVWAELSDDGRGDPRAWEIRYVFDNKELRRLAAALSWPARHGAKEVSR
jgi:DNA-binding transcriptional regulator YhcF (GntR family)